jgi:hypothetical protein
MIEDSSWIDAVHSCSDARGYLWRSAVEVEVFDAESYISISSTQPFRLVNNHPLRRLLAVLSGLNSTKMDREFGMVEDYDLELVCSVYDYPIEALLHVSNANDVVEQELTSVEKDFNQMMVPRLMASATSGFNS